MTHTPGTLEERLRFCEEHGLFTAAISNMVASYGEAADEIASLRARVEVMGNMTEEDCAAALKDADLDSEVYRLDDFLKFFNAMIARQALNDTPDAE